MLHWQIDQGRLIGSHQTHFLNKSIGASLCWCKMLPTELCLLTPAGIWSLYIVIRQSQHSTNSFDNLKTKSIPPDIALTLRYKTLIELSLIHLDRRDLYCSYMGEIILSNSHFIGFLGFIICQARSKEASGYSSNSKISRKQSYDRWLQEYHSQEGSLWKDCPTLNFFSHVISKDTCEGKVLCFFFT